MKQRKQRVKMYHQVSLNGRKGLAMYTGMGRITRLRSNTNMNAEPKVVTPETIKELIKWN